MCKFIITLISLAALAATPVIASESEKASAQQKTNAEKADSIVALLPQKQGVEKLNALSTLLNLTEGLASQKQYLYLYLDEARRQKDVVAESAALLKLTLLYYIRFDSDSIFIFGDEAVRFARQHKQYDDLFFAQCELIRRYKAQGQMLIALRKAEAAYAEAKALEQKMSMARILSSIGEIMYNLEQYEEARKQWVESIELAAPYRNPPNTLFVLQHYDLLCAATGSLDREQERLGYADSMQMEIERLQIELPDYNFQRYYFYVEYHRAMAYVGMKQPAKILEAIRRVEAVYDPKWNERNPSFAAQIDNLYAEYYRVVGNYDKTLELYNRNMRFDENAKREGLVVLWKKEIAQTLREKGDYKAAADLYDEVMKKKDELNNEQFYAQINELRTIYELDKTEMESERHLAALRQQRLVTTGFALACLALALMAALTLWSRSRIAAKNRGLYRQIKEQDRLAEDLERIKQMYEKETAATPSDESAPTPFGDLRQRQLVARFTKYLQDERHFSNSEIDLDVIISTLATNRSYFFEAVKAVSGKTPKEYIHNLRLEEAKQMLETRYDLNVEVIAEECGFNSRSAFYRLFRERYQINPSEYRRISLGL